MRIAAIVRHGDSAYDYWGCRCIVCTRAHTARVVDLRRAKRGQLADDDPRHGTHAGYDYWGCRCTPCSQAHSRRNRAQYARKRSREAAS